MIGWLDCASGVSGDMLLGALVDGGVPLQVLADAIEVVLPDGGIRLRSETVVRGGIAATKVHVEGTDSTLERTWADLRALLDRAESVAGQTRWLAAARATFLLLVEAEAAVHGLHPDAVHLHEVGALDAVADIAGVCAGFDQLGLTGLWCSPVALGGGTVATAHGRLAVPGPWKIVWRTPDADNGTELSVDGLALDRELLPTGEWGPNDGSAGLRGQGVKTDNDRELKLFAATILSAATAALPDTRLSTGLLGEASLPTATARNAALTGTSAVLREYAQSIRETIARDGLYLRVPAGKPFYLYVTQTLDLGQARRLAVTPSRP